MPRHPAPVPHPPAQPRQAVVLGGSLAGLLSARVLADHVDEVLVVDRDDLAADLDAPRRGVPQSAHTHGLLVGGTEAIESIVPGFGDELVARGALRADPAARGRWLIAGSQIGKRPSGLLGLLASRTLIESQIRRQVASVRNITLIGRHNVVGLQSSPDRSRVTGAVIAPSDRDAGGTRQRELPADVVVDATGRGSRAPVWLADLGYARPRETVVDARIRYVTRMFADRPGLHPGIDLEVVGTDPRTGRGGVALRQEGGQWAVTIAGQFGEEPPTGLDDYLAFAVGLPLGGIAEIVRSCEPVGDALTYSYPASRWRRWEQLDRRPEGLVVIGDAVCSFNPVYGQGMSSAALQATRLRDLLRDGGTRDLSNRSARAFAKVVASPWAQATGADLRFPGQPRKPFPDRVIDRYLDRLLAVAAHDATVAVAFARVLNLLDPPAALLAPGIARRVLGPASRALVARTALARAERAETVTAALAAHALRTADQP